MTDAEIKLADWMVGNDSGLSSLFMARVFMGGYGKGQNCPHPWDPADFGRCHRLLELVPECRARMDELRGYSDVWDRFVDNWGRLTEIYLRESPDGTAPVLYAEMEKITHPKV